MKKNDHEKKNYFLNQWFFMSTASLELVYTDLLSKVVFF